MNPFHYIRKALGRQRAKRLLFTAKDTLNSVERTSNDPLLTHDEMRGIVTAKFSEIMGMGMNVSETRDIFIAMLLDAFQEHPNPNPRTTTLLLFFVQEETARRMEETP